MTTRARRRRLGVAPRSGRRGRAGGGAVGPVPRPERVGRRHRDRLPGGVLADQRCRLEGGDPLRAVVAGRRRLAGLRHRPRRRPAPDHRLRRRERPRAAGAAPSRRHAGPRSTRSTTRPRRRPPPTGRAWSSFFADVGLIAYAPDGTERWRAPLGPFVNFYGMSGSPIIAGDLVVLVCDQASGSFMLALDRATGRQRWRRERPGSTGWSTPIVFTPPGAGAIHSSSCSARPGSKPSLWTPASRAGGSASPRTGPWARRSCTATRCWCPRLSSAEPEMETFAACWRSSTPTRTVACRARNFRATRPAGPRTSAGSTPTATTCCSRRSTTSPVT